MARINLIQIRRGTAAAWTSANPILSSGECGFETDTGKLKIGDGTTAWATLLYNGAVVTYGTSSGTACEGNDSRLTNVRTPSSHASTHSSGQADAVSVENLVFNANTTNDVGTTKHGLTPMAPTDTTKWLNGLAGTWVVLSIDGGSP